MFYKQEAVLELLDRIMLTNVAVVLIGKQGSNFYISDLHALCDGLLILTFFSACFVLW